MNWACSEGIKLKDGLKGLAISKAIITASLGPDF